MLKASFMLRINVFILKASFILRINLFIQLKIILAKSWGSKSFNFIVGGNREKVTVGKIFPNVV